MTSTTTERLIPRGTRKLTYEDYCELPEDRNRYEIIDGELHMTPSPTTRHQIISRNLEWFLHEYARRTDAGVVLHAPMDVILDPDDRENVLQPDILFVRSTNLDILQSANIQGAPNLAIEIFSPSTRRRDALVKSKVYAQFGVSDYWLADPDLDLVEMYALGDGGEYDLLDKVSKPDTLRNDRFPGLEIPLDEVFEDLR